MTVRAKSPKHDLYPMAAPYFVGWRPTGGNYLTPTLDSSPIFIGSDDPVAQKVPGTGAALPAGSYVGSSGGGGYIVNSSGVPILVALSGAAQTWVGLQTFGDGATFLDGDVLTFGTGSDVILTPDGTNLVVTGAGRIVWADSEGPAFGTGLDITIAWDGTRLLIGQAAENSAIWLGVDGAGIDLVLFGDTAGATAAWDQSADSFLITAGAKLVMNDGSLFQQKGAGSTGTGDVIQRVGATELEGMEVRVFETTVTPAAIETALLTLPANSVVDSVQANVQAALTGGGTTATVSIGITGDVDLFGTVFSAGAQADSLAKNAKINMIGTKTDAGAGIGVFNPAAVAVKLIGAAAGGATAGDTALTVGSVRVVIRYRALVSLTDAP